MGVSVKGPGAPHCSRAPCQSTLGESELDESTIRTLIERVRRGEGGAFEALYDHFAPRLYSYFYHRAGGRAELAEKLTEALFSGLIARLQTDEDRGSSFQAWLYR